MPRFSPNGKFLEKVKGTVAGLSLLAPGDRVLATVSGGADSVALFHALLRLGKDGGFSLGVAHLDHGLRGDDARADALFVRDLAHAHGVPFFLEQVDAAALAAGAKISVEEAGRRARYAFFQRVCETKGFDRIATGHHADDNAEWVVMALLRGAGPAGLSGIPATRGRVVRPLIRCSRGEIREFLEENNLAWQEDATNQDPAMVRNRVRLRVLPFLEQEVSPGAVAAVNRASGILADEEDWWGRNLDSLLGDGFFSPGPDGPVGFSASRMAALHPAPARRALRWALLAAGVPAKSLSTVHLEDVRELAGRGPDPGEIHLPGRMAAQRRGDRVAFVRRPERGAGEA
ncbi:MAG: tRNA lysidine(34) synthetase TilS, partial [Pseudomonadota bacterium]